MRLKASMPSTCSRKATTIREQLELLTERLSVRELIRSRVFQEVKDYNARKPEFFRGGQPWLGDVYYRTDIRPLVAYDWIYTGLTREERG